MREMCVRFVQWCAKALPQPVLERVQADEHWIG
jgi:hypothetical protein